MKALHIACRILAFVLAIPALFLLMAIGLLNFADPREARDGNMYKPEDL